jgi:hypothetical protein
MYFNWGAREPLNPLSEITTSHTSESGQDQWGVRHNKRDLPGLVPKARNSGTSAKIPQKRMTIKARYTSGSNQNVSSSALTVPSSSTMRSVDLCSETQRMLWLKMCYCLLAKGSFKLGVVSWLTTITKAKACGHSQRHN